MRYEKEMATINVNDDSFESEVLKSDVPVVVDFWAEWWSMQADWSIFGRTF